MLTADNGEYGSVFRFCKPISLVLTGEHVLFSIIDRFTKADFREYFSAVVDIAFTDFACHNSLIGSMERFLELILAAGNGQLREFQVLL